MTAIQTFQIEPRAPVLFGAGTIQRLPELVTSLGQQRVFLATDHGVAAAGVAGAVSETLTAVGIEVSVFDGIHPNPGTDVLDAGARIVRAFGPSAVVALGGGAVLDVAKGLALMAVNAGTARDFDYSRDFEHEGLPLVAVPTTAGTGSETNAWGVIDDHEAGRKFYIGHHSVTPRYVVLDPELTVGVPARATASAGMDTLTHAFESLSSLRSNPYADGLNVQAITMVASYLPRAVVDGADLEARGQLLLAAHLAGLAFGTTGLGVAHALGHALSARVGAPHGTALAVLLPHVLEFNLPVCESIYAGIAGSLGLAGPTVSQTDRAQTCIAEVRRLAREVGIAPSLQQFGCTAAHLPTIAEAALTDAVMANTPRPPTRDELDALLQRAL